MPRLGLRAFVAKKARETYQRPPRSVVLSLISAGNASGILTNAYTRTRSRGSHGGVNVERAARTPFAYARVVVHNVAFSYSTVTQDITYHNAEINAADGAWRWMTRGCEWKELCRRNHFVSSCDKSARWMFLRKKKKKKFRLDQVIRKISLAYSLNPRHDRGLKLRFPWVAQLRQTHENNIINVGEVLVLRRTCSEISEEFFTFCNINFFYNKKNKYRLQRKLWLRSYQKYNSERGGRKMHQVCEIQTNF